LAKEVGMPPTSALQIAQAQFDYTSARLGAALHSVHLLAWLLVAAAVGLVAVWVNFALGEPLRTTPSR
jgi:hypothetical protein